ncbi:bola protein [Cantharellus anzutake]|uniref:bola protein n=1 Tax=Cantharellus anzutake TaxID=1750568 RepID=UPI0019055D85|nr:bola protein [Cantharellus anzutake]KAF8341221.1 bola protein [Cantharellus anzutake]
MTSLHTAIAVLDVSLNLPISNRCREMPVSPEVIEETLKRSLNIIHLSITDTSSGCGQNYEVLIVSDDFEGKKTLERHKLVNEILKDVVAQLHAFSQKSLTLKQYEAQRAKGLIA